jgi:RHS repeat-associated protein
MRIRRPHEVSYDALNFVSNDTTGKHWLAASTGAVADTWAYDATGNATYEASAALWGGYGSSGTTTSPIYSTSSVGSTNRALVYTYDGKNRPVKVAIAAANASQTSTAASANTVTYRFNALGQRVLKVGAGTFAAPTVFPYGGTLSNPPTQTQLQTLNAGTQAFYANSRFVYDEKGRLLGEYSKEGKLIQETVWFDDLPVAILKPKGASITNPISGTGNVATNNQDANNTGANGNASPPAAPTSKVNVEIFYSHPDHLGTPRVITASAPIAATQGTGITSAQTINKAVWRWDSDPFGSNATATSAPNENPNTLNQVVGTATLPYLFAFDLAFPGQKRDRESGKHQNGFREYDPAIGRFPQSDPIGLEAGLNTYGYVNQMPNRWSDRFGLAVQVCQYPIYGVPLIPHAGICIEGQCRGWGPEGPSQGSWNDNPSPKVASFCYPADPPKFCDQAKYEACIWSMVGYPGTQVPGNPYSIPLNNCQQQQSRVTTRCAILACSSNGKGNK